MRLISNTGVNRVIDALRQSFQSGASLDIATPFLSLFAFSELRDLLNHAAHSRLILPLNPEGDLTFLGSAADRPARNRLHGRWLARECANWIREKVELRQSSSLLPQSAYFNPDWAVLVEMDGAERLYFVVETKSSLFTDDLRDRESAKITCGEAHFKALESVANPARFIKASKLEDVLLSA